MNKRNSALIVFLLLFICSAYRPGPKPSTEIKTVVIDAGHGGKDPGNVGTQFKEKDIALAVALKFGKHIEDNFKDVKVIYTRKTDTFPELNERPTMANNNKADLFISIHCNASVSKSAHGSETFVMGLGNEKGSIEVAKRENSAILMEDNYEKKYEGFNPNSDEANIIFTMYQTTYVDLSLNLASKIQSQYKEKVSKINRGVKRASFWVLWKAAMPSILTEIGFYPILKSKNILVLKKVRRK